MRAAVPSQVRSARGSSGLVVRRAFHGDLPAPPRIEVAGARPPHPPVAAALQQRRRLDRDLQLFAERTGETLRRPRRLDGAVDIQLDDLDLARFVVRTRSTNVCSSRFACAMPRRMAATESSVDRLDAVAPIKSTLRPTSLARRSSLAALIVIELQHVLDGAAPDDIGDLSRGQLTPAAEADDDGSRRQLQRFLQRCGLADDDRVRAERPRVQPEVVACRQRAIEQAIDDGFRADDRVGLVMADDDGEAREARDRRARR